MCIKKKVLITTAMLEIWGEKDCKPVVSNEMHIKNKNNEQP